MKLASGSLLLAFSSTMLLSSCGGGSGAHFPQNVSVTISPVITSIAAGSTQQFTATVANYSATPSWGVDPTAPIPGTPGSGGIYTPGTISSSGLYTGPAAPPIINYGGAPGPQGVATVYAMVIYPAPDKLLGATATDSQTFVITAPSVTAGIYPATATVPLGGTFKFQPYAVGNMNRAYTLQINGVPGGSMSTGTIVQDMTNAGLYTAPTAMPMTGNTVTITVISAADPTKTASATVTLQ